MRFGKSDKVTYTGCNDSQAKWGRGDDPRKVLVVGDKYVVQDIEIHSWHTVISLEGVDGHFNDTCFANKRDDRIAQLTAELASLRGSTVPRAWLGQLQFDIDETIKGYVANDTMSPAIAADFDQWLNGEFASLLRADADEPGPREYKCTDPNCKTCKDERHEEADRLKAEKWDREHPCASCATLRAELPYVISQLQHYADHQRQTLNKPPRVGETSRLLSVLRPLATPAPPADAEDDEQVLEMFTHCPKCKSDCSDMMDSEHGTDSIKGQFNCVDCGQVWTVTFTANEREWDKEAPDA